MVVPPSNSSSTPMRSRTKPSATGIPTIDLSSTASDRRALSKLLVEACEVYGFFKLINHGVPQHVIARVEEEAIDFFDMPAAEKFAAGPTNPPASSDSTRFGYGVKNIGLNGDMGEIEYLLLSADPSTVSQLSLSKFSCALNDYIQAIKNVVCELLDLMAEGLGISDKSIFSRMILDDKSDSLFRINHYRPVPEFINIPPSDKIGFGEHSDPQILTILRSNDVGGLQILLDDGLWVPISPDPTAYYIMIGDLFPVLTNGRFVSLKHRAVVNTGPKPRMSMAYFASSSLDTLISPLPELVTSDQPCLYRPFTWAQYKSHIYSLPLGFPKLDSFKIIP